MEDGECSLNEIFITINIIVKVESRENVQCTCKSIEKPVQVEV